MGPSIVELQRTAPQLTGGQTEGTAVDDRGEHACGADDRTGAERLERGDAHRFGVERVGDGLEDGGALLARVCAAQSPDSYAASAAAAAALDVLVARRALIRETTSPVFGFSRSIPRSTEGSDQLAVDELLESGNLDGGRRGSVTSPPEGRPGSRRGGTAAVVDGAVGAARVVRDASTGSAEMRVPRTVRMRRISPPR